MFGFRKAFSRSILLTPPSLFLSVSQEIIEVESENVFKLAANALQVSVFKCATCIREIAASEKLLKREI